MSALGIINALGGQDYTVRRYASPTASGGYLERGAMTTTTARGLIAPLSGRDLQYLPEGLRQRAAYQFLTADTLRTGSEGVSADVVVVGSEAFEVTQMADYRHTAVAGNAYALLREA